MPPPPEAFARLSPEVEGVSPLDPTKLVCVSLSPSDRPLSRSYFPSSPEAEASVCSFLCSITLSTELDTL